MQQCYFFLRHFWLIKWSFLYTHCSTTRFNAPYVHSRYDTILELCQTFMIIKQSWWLQIYEIWLYVSSFSIVDLCESSPCLYGTACTPSYNDYTCSCPLGYSGKNCQLRQRTCDRFNCFNGLCVDDYKTDEARCICSPGYYYGKAWFFFH